MCAVQLDNLSSLVNSVSADFSSIKITKSKLISNKSKNTKLKKKCENPNKQKVNARERERKELLTNLIKKLQDILPINKILLKKKKNVITEAINYIMQLKTKNEELLKNNASENMVQELEKLRSRVKELEKEKILYQAILQSHGIPATLSANTLWKTKVGLPKNKSSSTSQSNQIQPTVIQIKNIADQSLKHIVVPPIINNPILNFITVPTTSQRDSMKYDTSNQSCSASSLTSIATASAQMALCTNGNDSTNKKCTKSKDFQGKLCASSVLEISSSAENNHNPLKLSTEMSSTQCVSKSTKKPIPNVPSVEQKNLVLAECKTVWSQARIKTSKSKIPNLQSVAMEKVFEQQTISTDNISPSSSQDSNLNFQQFNLPTLQPYKNLTSSISTANSSDIISVFGSTAKPIPLIVLNSQPSIITNPSIAPTVMNVELQMATQTPILPQIQSACELIEPSVSNEQPLVFWLRSNDQNNQDTTENSTQTYNIDIPDTPTKYNASQLFASPTNPNKRPAHGSFNIADLIKPRDISTPLLADGNNNIPKLVVTANQDNSDTNEFSIGTPRDLLYQTFDNDFLECLQNLNSFTTPEPPSRHIPGGNKSDKRKNNFISIDLPDLFRPAIDNITGQQADSDRSQINDNGFSLNNFSTVPLSGYTDRFTSNHTTSLWQPAITNQPSHSKILTNYIPNHHPPADCDPVPYYLNLNQSNIPRFCHSAPIQPITHYNSVDSTQMWIPSAQQDHNLVQIQQSILPPVQVTKPSSTKQKKLDLPKKRKLTRSYSGNKRKKSTTKLQQKGISSQHSGPFIQNFSEAQKNYQNRQTRPKNCSRTLHAAQTLFSTHSKNTRVGFNHDFTNQNSFYLPANSQQQTSYTPSPYLYQYNTSNSTQGNIFVPNLPNSNNSNNGPKSNKSSQHHISQILG